MYKFLPIITAGRMASSTLCSKLDKLDNCISYWEAFRETIWLSSYNGYNDYSKEEGPFRRHQLAKDIKDDISDECKEDNVKEEFISFKLFNHHLTPGQVKNLLLPSDNNKVKVIILKRNLHDTFTSLTKAKLTSNWGTTPDKQKSINHKFGILKVDVEIDTTSYLYRRYTRIMNRMFMIWEDYCNKKNIPYEIIHFEDVISDDFDASKLLF